MSGFLASRLPPQKGGCLASLLESDAWFPASEVRALERELQEIAAAFRKLPSDRMKSAFQRVAEAHTAAGSRCKCALVHVDDQYSYMTIYEYSLNDIGPFGRQLQEIAAAFRELPSAETIEALNGTSEDGGGGGSLYDCFRDANGANLFDCLLELCAVAIERDRPIIFT